MINIKTIQQLWSAVILHQNDGDSDTAAMTNVYGRMAPQLTYQDLANVLSAVYADTYWSSTFMDSTILATNMVSALNISNAVATQYASNAVTQWYGTFTRNNFSDTGTIPQTTDFTSCVDTICSGQSQMSTDTLINNWGTSYWTAPQVGKNYMYARCQNLNFMGNILPNVQMYSITPGMNVPTSQWTQLKTASECSTTGQIYLLGGATGTMAQGVHGVSEAFIFNPTSTDHICIATVFNDGQYFTQNNPLTVPQSNWNAVTWVTYTGAAGWHNTNPVTEEVTALDFYNQDARPEKFAFVAHCNKLPKGTVIKLDPQLQDSASNNGEISQCCQEVSTEATLPANYNGKLLVSIKTPDGKPLPEGASVKVEMLWLLDREHERHLDAAKLMGTLNTTKMSQTVKLSMGSFTLYGAE